MDPEDLVDGGDDEAEEGDETGTYIGDLTPDEFFGMLDQHLMPLLTALDAPGQINDIAAKMQELAGGFQRTKEISEKAASENTAKIAQLQQSIKEAQAQIAALSGELPRGVKAYQASADPATVVTSEEKLKAAQTGEDGQLNGNIVTQFLFGNLPNQSKIPDGSVTP